MFGYEGPPPGANNYEPVGDKYHDSPMLFYFSRDANVRQLKYIDTEIEQNLHQ